MSTATIACTKSEYNIQNGATWLPMSNGRVSRYQDDEYQIHQNNDGANLIQTLRENINSRQALKRYRLKFMQN